MWWIFNKIKPYYQESRTALEGVPSIQQISTKQLEYVLKVGISICAFLTVTINNKPYNITSA